MTNKPSTTTDIALSRAITLLNACGFEYAIKKTDGTVIGQLAVVTTKQKKAKVRINNFVKEFPGYPQQIGKMKVGDVLRWVVGTDRAPQFQSAVSGHASQRLGAGTFISTRTGEKRDTIELLYVGK